MFVFNMFNSFVLLRDKPLPEARLKMHAKPSRVCTFMARTGKNAIGQTTMCMADIRTASILL